MLFSIKKILRFYLGVAFLKSVSIYCSHIEYFVYVFGYYVFFSFNNIESGLKGRLTVG